MYLLQAVKRDPNDVLAWQQLAVADFALGSPRGSYDAIRRVLALDPEGEPKALPRQLELLVTPPAGSATSRPSPAPPG
jgi:hypothetical protein